MIMRVALVAMAVAIFGAAAGAQPDKEQPQAKAPATAAAPVLLASATDARRSSATTADRRGEPVRRPAPRVTKCRCADQRPAADQPADQQPDQ